MRLASANADSVAAIALAWWRFHDATVLAAQAKLLWLQQCDNGWFSTAVEFKNQHALVEQSSSYCRMQHCSLTAPMSTSPVMLIDTLLASSHMPSLHRAVVALCV